MGEAVVSPLSIALCPRVAIPRSRAPAPPEQPPAWIIPSISPVAIRSHWSAAKVASATDGIPAKTDVVRNPATIFSMNVSLILSLDTKVLHRKSAGASSAAVPTLNEIAVVELLHCQAVWRSAGDSGSEGRSKSYGHASKSGAPPKIRLVGIPRWGLIAPAAPRPGQEPSRQVLRSCP